MCYVSQHGTARKKESTDRRNAKQTNLNKLQRKLTVKFSIGFMRYHYYHISTPLLRHLTILGQENAEKMSPAHFALRSRVLFSLFATTFRIDNVRMIQDVFQKLEAEIQEHDILVG